jgi:hypothetical protein
MVEKHLLVTQGLESLMLEKMALRTKDLKSLTMDPLTKDLESLALKILNLLVQDQIPWVGS